jgi:ribosomal protein L37AE/L43A
MAISQKEPLKKVQIVALSYYARKDIQNAIYEFCKNRETIGNFNNKFFGKRPDYLDYPSDILNSARQGVTSFHCSEELWSNPLDINTDMSPKEYNEIKIGWDLLIDIDSKFFDYSKIAAKLLVQTLEYHGIKNIGIKFSGSKGFHIIIPFKAFPKFIGDEETKNNFPEWPRIMAEYIFHLIKEPMNREIMKLTSREELQSKGELISEHICPKCGKPAQKKIISKYLCPNFKCKSSLSSMKASRKKLRCPSCNGNMDKVGEEEIYFCEECKINTEKINQSVSSFGGERKQIEIEFKKEETTKAQIDSVDIVLVSSRHLFRAPYSLHEKTALTSLPIKKNEIEKFIPSDADPLKIKTIQNFMPDSEEDEARELLMQALDWGRKNKPIETASKKYEGAGIDIKGLTITEEMFPPEIKKILQGIKSDGRKRALSILLAFLTSLEFPKDYIEEKISEWNKKNYSPLKESYIRSQLEWFLKNKRLPPNYDKPIYKEFGVRGPPEPGIKNPINYTIKMAMRNKGKK